MRLKRILQLALSSLVGQGVTIVSQLLVPPFFFHYYSNGAEVYGEWIALSASIYYLGTLNYGVQTYSNNAMAILYNRGDVSGAKSIQASAFRLLLLLIGAFVIGGTCMFYIPIVQLLNLKHVGRHEASVTVYILIVQMAFLMLFTLLTNSFMVIGKLHRGNCWRAAQRLTGVLLLGLAVTYRSTLATLALVQLASIVPFLILVAIDLRKVAPVLLPSLRCGTWRQTKNMLKPSGHFGLISLGEFLTWQGPVILIQRILGSNTVSLFALSRVVFQMSRQILLIASSMISQDITILVGQKSWVLLRRLYSLSEKVVLLLIPVVSVGTLLLCPLLFSVWLHKREFYHPALCILMAIVSAVLGVKEHKIQFQSSSNEHERLSIVVVIGYIAMLIVSIATMRSFGLAGFMLTWLAWEIIQTALIMRMNAVLFPSPMRVSVKPILRLSIFMSLAFSLAIYPAYQAVKWPIAVVSLVALCLVMLLGAAAYVAFGLDEVHLLLKERIRRRSSAKVAHC